MFIKIVFLFACTNIAFIKGGQEPINLNVSIYLLDKKSGRRMPAHY